MTSARLELEQLVYSVAWPVRALAAVTHTLDPLLRSSMARRVAKAGVDFFCAVGAVVAAVAVGEGVNRFGPGNTATLAGIVGLLVVAADTLCGSYRTIWRYTSLKEVMAVGFSIGRELLVSAAAGVELVGFLDDDPAKLGAALNGVPVLGRLQDALALAERHHVSEVIVAMPSARPDAVRTFGLQLEGAGVRVRAVRGIERF